jgi:rubrerythrin
MFYNTPSMAPPCMIPTQEQYTMLPCGMPVMVNAEGWYSHQESPEAIMDSQYTYPYNLAEAIELIKEAVLGESEDRKFYEYLISVAPTVEEKEIIKGIRDDEIEHFGLFRHIYYELTGQMLPSPKEEKFKKPSSYCEGIKNAIIGEQNAVRKYAKILFAMQNRVHINKLVRIITDEIRHGSQYNLLFAKNRCR